MTDKRRIEACRSQTGLGAYRPEILRERGKRCIPCLLQGGEVSVKKMLKKWDFFDKYGERVEKNSKVRP